MEQNNIFPKVAKDMFWIQSTWTFGFLGIMLAINIFKIIYGIIQNTGVDDFYNSIFVAGNIYMLIIGIISVYFLPHYVENGVTRKDYFKGSLLASIGLSMLIPIVAYIVSIIEKLLLKNWIDFKETNFIPETDSNFIGDIIQSIILTPYVNPESNLILAIVIFSLNVFTYYLIGWLIGAGFYRFNAGTGFVFILIALIMITLEDVLLRISLDLPMQERFAILDTIPSGVTALGVLLILIVTTWIIRQLTKSVAIKM